MTPAGSLPGGGASREERPRERPISVGVERSTSESAPGIHYATWHAFQEAINAPESFAIDVLSGEPGDMPAFAARPKLRGARRQEDGSVRSSEAPPPQPPERIRINSKGVIRILSIIHRTALSPGGQPLLLFRPYRALVGFQKEIRRWISRLEKKLGQPSREFGEESNRSNGEEDLESSDGDDYIDNGLYTPGTLHDLRSILQVLEHHIRPRLDYVRSPGCHLVAFSDLWLLFSPGDLVVRRDERQVYRIVGISTSRDRKGGARRPGWSRFAAKTSPLALEDSAIIIECVYIDCDGQKFGPVRQVFSVDNFEGETEITSLDIFPLRLLTSEKVENLAKRGRRVLQASKIEIMHHEGVTIDSGLQARGSVVVDPKEALIWGDSGFERPEIHRFYPPKPGFLWQRTGPGEESEDDSSDGSVSQLAPDEVSFDDRRIEARRGSTFIRCQMGKERERIGSSSLAVIARTIETAGDCPEEDLLVVHYRVFGFLLDTQAWAQLDIDNLTAADASVYADKLNELVLPLGHQEALNSLIRHYSFATDSIVILLHGPPGLGKSSSAKCIAGLNGKPPLQLLPRDVGGTIKEMDKAMETQLRRAARWGCCTLIRELDTIADDMNTPPERLGMFVRFLDRCKGVVILTSTRVGKVAEAVRSRLHLSLYYPQLTKKATLEIFTANIDRVRNRRGPENGPSDLLIRVDASKILDFAAAYYDQHIRNRWSGKRIRANFDSALAFAISEAEDQQRAGYGDGAKSVMLTLEHFEKVAMSQLGFDSYMEVLRGGDDDALYARRQQLRVDEYIPEAPQQTKQRRQRRDSSSGERSPSIFDRVLKVASKHQRSSNPPPALSPSLDAMDDKGRKVLPFALTLTNTQSNESTPQLNFVDWETFKAGRGRPKESGFAIEVLLGDPVVDLSEEFTENMWWARWSEGSLKKYDSSAGDSAGKPRRDPGSSTVPERIRIRSGQIVTLLSHIFGSPLSRYGEAVVMTRPYRALIYHRDRIQQELERLKALGPDPSHSKRSVPGSPRVPSVSTGPSSSEELDATTAADESTRHLRCLVTFLETAVDARAKYLASSRCHLVTFADLWQLFKPGDEIFSAESKQAFRVVSVDSTFHRFLPPWKTWGHKTGEKGSRRPSVVIQYVCVDFDGTMIGPTLHQEEIEEFDGEKPVRALTVYPLRFANMSELFNRSTPQVPYESPREALIARGREFLDVLRIKPRHYNGLTTDTKEEIDSQVVVDFEQADVEGKGRQADQDKPPIYSLIGEEIGVPQTGGACAYECCSGDDIHNDNYVDDLRNAEYISACVPASEGLQPTAMTEELSLAIHPRALTDINPAKVSEKDLVIMSAHVYGFVLRSRKWAKLNVESLSPIGSQGRDLGQAKPPGTGDEEQDITYDTSGQPVHTKESVDTPSVYESHRPTAFDHLVLPDGHKEIVMSLVGQHFHDRALKSQKTQQMDIVRGKGKGLIILLHGAPGVGKTTTAEGVAEVFNKPLFQITCGDLGTTAVDVENALERHFALASRWDCVLLLDEADVFMAERSPQDFKRNSFVTVFLRVLEYYTGILFLTTNRIGDFDEAFSSRIHVSLYYPPLQLEPTLEIFRLNLGLIRKRTAEWAKRAKGQQQRQQASTDIDEKDILRFASKYWKSNKKMRWNGRQIRNGCQTALALAEYEAQRGVGGNVAAADHAAGEESSSSLPPGAAASSSNSSSRHVVVNARAEALREADSSAPVHLTARHLEIVSEAYLGFMRYLQDVHGRDAERRAKYMGIRARELTHNLSEMRKDTELAKQLDEDDGGENSKATTAVNNKPWTTNVGADGPKTTGTGSPSAVAPTTPSGSQLQSPRPLQPVSNPLYPRQQQLQTQQQIPNLQGFHQLPLQHTPHGHPATPSVQPPSPVQVSLAMPMVSGGAFDPQIFQQNGPFAQQQQAQNMAAFAGMGQPLSQAQLLAAAHQQHQQQQLQQLQLQAYMMANPSCQLPQQQLSQQQLGQQQLGQQQMPQQPQQPQQHQQQFYHDTASSLGGGSLLKNTSHGSGPQ